MSMCVEITQCCTAMVHSPYDPWRRFFFERSEVIVEYRHKCGRRARRANFQLQPIVGFKVMLTSNEGALVTDDLLLVGGPEVRSSV